VTPAAPRARSFDELAARLLELPPSCGPDVRLIAVDGPGGAGKSTFATRLAGALGDAPIVHTDDFASWDEQFDWHPRLLAELIEPLRAGRPARFRRYDWVERRFGRRQEVPPSPAVIVEGVGAARREFADALAYVIWIDTPANVRLARGLARDGEELRDFWQQWIAGENRHFAADRTRERADLVVDGNPAAPYDPESQFVAVT
jgi:uridine kinase